MGQGRDPLRLEEHVEEGADAVRHLQVELGAIRRADANADLFSAREGQRLHAFVSIVGWCGWFGQVGGQTERVALGEIVNQRPIRETGEQESRRAGENGKRKTRQAGEMGVWGGGREVGNQGEAVR